MAQHFTDPIGPFTGEFRFLSNFFPVAVVYEAVVYPTAEHAFQAAKTLDPLVRARIRALPTAGAAKRSGRSLTLRSDWEQVKLTVMEQILRAKFQHPVLRAHLLRTHPRPLVEVNTWSDRFWGVCHGSGENHLGRLLMALRHEFLTADQPPVATDPQRAVS
ncbi:MAG: NADAR family protein [Deltaproteobacteria bacterium]|nr:NADAR family protein [Deltaproteobacteria bacterium]